MTTEKIKVLLADDHTIVIDGLLALLPQHNINVVGAVEVASDIMASFERLSPDVLILDIRFGERRSGLETGKELLQKHPSAKVVFLSQFDQDGIIREVYEIGALAYLTKNCRSEELIAAIRSAALGTTYFLPDITKRLLNI